MAVWRIRRRLARRAATRLVASAIVAAVAAVGLATTAAAQSGYTDVTGRTHKANIEALAEMGLFEGTECGEQQFCPDDPANRWTVAVWIVRALDGADPPPVAQSRFADVDDDEWWMPYVERLADLQITVGCGTEPLRFCPDQTVTRARMASFLVRAFDLAETPSAGFADTEGSVHEANIETPSEGFADTEGSTHEANIDALFAAGFADTEGSVHEANIDALFAAGITVGCMQDPLRFCPNNPVSRAQMASLLRRGLDTRPEIGSFSIGEGPRSGDTLLAASRGRTCAVRLDSTVACWGGDEGLLEHMSASGLDDVAALSTGQDPIGGLHTCAVHTDGTVSCWGPGHDGQLGQGNTSTHHLPVVVPGITGAVAVAVGSGFTCVAHRDGGVSCWGRNWYGQLGVHTEESSRRTPERVPGLADVVAISAGQDHICAVRGNGDLSCWGWVYGNSTSFRITSVGLVASVSSGGTQTCVTTVDGHVYCWDLATTTVRQASLVSGISDAVETSVGDGTVCVLHRDGGVSCWGENSVGQVGEDTTVARSEPVRLGGIADAVDVSVSSGSPDVGPHACAVHQDGSVSCWGGNELGQLGDGTRDNGLTPRRVNELDPVPADQIPTTPTQLLLDWTDAVVQHREADSPWLRVAWDHIRDDTSVVQSGFGGFVNRYCYAHAASDAFGCGAANMAMTEISLAVIHELLHVYDLHTGLAPSTAWGAVQLYFATTYPDCFAGGDLHGAEILADTVLHVMAPQAWLTYYESSGCPTLPVGSLPTLEAKQVVLQGMAGEVPDWYRENITNGAELWAAWLRGPSVVALANLVGEFGGLCSTDWITYPLDPARFPPAGSNPFKDGGC